MHNEDPLDDGVQVYPRYCDCCARPSTHMMFDNLSARYLCRDRSRRLCLRRALGLPSRRAQQ